MTTIIQALKGYLINLSYEFIVIAMLCKRDYILLMSDPCKTFQSLEFLHKNRRQLHRETKIHGQYLHRHNNQVLRYFHELQNTTIATRQALHHCLCGKKTKEAVRVGVFGTEESPQRVNKCSLYNIMGQLEKSS